ncbi:MAG: methylmalonyl-CoA mutase family protein, partial [Actinobacteria bacterium]|nr:methylmalonyl-CoA mutase family protein [Actinomycetota bacterium]
MISSMVEECDVDLVVDLPPLEAVLAGNDGDLARAITVLEEGRAPADWLDQMHAAAVRSGTPVLGITGTGGSGKSTLTDELLRRFRADQEGKLRIAVIAVDPTRRKGGGALLGDRIRMNAVDLGGVYFRSLATRKPGSEIPEHLADVIAACKTSHDLVIVETPGIGQGDAGIVPFVDASLYVMTPEFGAASQLEKIDMLDFADAVAINKFERRGAEDARRDVARQLVRNRQAFSSTWEDMPVFGTSAARFADDGVTHLFHFLSDLLVERGLTVGTGVLPRLDGKEPTSLSTVVPPARGRYLAEIAEAVRGYHAATDQQAGVARRAQHLRTAALLLSESGSDPSAVESLLLQQESELRPEIAQQLAAWPAIREQYAADELVVRVRNTELHTALWKETLSGSRIPRVSLPSTEDAGELVHYLREENVPGSFPYTAGVFAFKREGEAPARMFAGEGDPFRTNRRFHLLASGQPATRLSTAFDSVTLYGRDPNEEPDVYGKVGTSGVSIATLDDMKVLYSGFDLCDPTTSVS